jgi:hypothetical protein
MRYSEFTPLNDYRTQMDLSPVCSLVDCPRYSNIMNVTLDSNINDRLLFMTNTVDTN